MSTFECPHCRVEVNTSDIPDHINEMKGSEFTYECDCGHEFAVEVDWEPICYPREDTLVPSVKRPWPAP